MTEAERQQSFYRGADVLRNLVEMTDVVRKFRCTPVEGQAISKAAAAIKSFFPDLERRFSALADTAAEEPDNGEEPERWDGLS